MVAGGDAENLSEILFKPSFVYPETSQISNGGCPLPETPAGTAYPGFYPHWYRPLRLPDWVGLGGNYLDLQEALARIATAAGARSRPTCLDTVKEYGPGHWGYEFNAVGQRRAVQARQLEDDGQTLLAAHHYRMAARYFAVAAYPELRGDSLAAIAAVQSLRAYRRVFACAPRIGRLQVAELTVRGHKVALYVHLPPGDAPVPAVIVCGGYAQSLTDFYRLITRHLLPRGLAAVLVQLPGQGTAERLELTAEYSEIITAALGYAAGLPQLLGTRLGLLGMHLGGTACLRAAVLQPQAVRAQVLIEPPVEAVFAVPALIDGLPLCLRSVLANRLGEDAADYDLLRARLQALSPKKQGLLSAAGRDPTPTWVSAGTGRLTTAADLKLLGAHYRDCTAAAPGAGEPTGLPGLSGPLGAQAADFLAAHLGGGGHA